MPSEDVYLGTVPTRANSLYLIIVHLCVNCCNPKIIEDIVVKKSHADDRIKVAQRTNLPLELVAQLANDRVEAVRSMIASRTGNSTFR